MGFLFCEFAEAQISPPPFVVSNTGSAGYILVWGGRYRGTWVSSEVAAGQTPWTGNIDGAGYNLSDAYLASNVFVYLIPVASNSPTSKQYVDEGDLRITNAVGDFVTGDLLRYDGTYWVPTSGFCQSIATNSNDYTKEYFTNYADNSYYDLDLSTNSIGETLVPAAAKAISYRVAIKDDNVSGNWIISPTNTEWASGIVRVNVAGIVIDSAGASPIQDSVVEVKLSANMSNATIVDFKVIGWWY